MKRILSCALLSLIITDPCHATIKGGADRLINQVDPATNIGIEVIDLNTGTILYRRNQDQPFVPASNMKLFSDAAALMVLGPDYRFINTLSTNASQLQNGVLKGSLYLKLSGDPSFSRERLANLLAVLKNWHINHIQGNVIIDSSHAVVNPYAPGWMTSDLAYSYGAPLGPTMIDANRMVATVNPGGRPGDPAVVEVDDDSGSIIVNNEVKTKEKSARCGVSFVMDQENHLNVRGCIGVGQWAIQQKMAIRNPLAYAKGLVRQQLSKENIILDGNVLLGGTPSGAMLLATDSSKPIAQLMADTLKPSDNLYADSLFLHAAHKLHGSPQNWPEAQQTVKKFLQDQTGISLQQAILTDGSGLSRNDLLTAGQTVNLLRFLYERFPLAYEYIAALPVSGRDGTLQRRFKRPEQQDMVRAKTGTMTGIVSLSGYLYTANGHTLAFAMYINNRPGTSPSISGKYRYLIDALCTYFLQQKPGNNSWSRMFASKNRIKYQMNPTQAEQQRGKQARWRRLETVVKQAVNGQAVTVIYRGNELLLKDTQADPGRVLNALLALKKKYPFAIAVSSKTSIGGNLLWMDTASLPGDSQRVWMIREAVS
ncbi:D-alanyl-D-alanine carboxypeptidase/D-alanyl-D-alanine-endopeptidase [Legionella quinlivanii]|uniref:D-alanyl-D-alanine carboxypeptidase/D-alanyl-D-alanine-endopeptidase n=1 Tax=Legionella quinlivanii TaxID=45073 RepID=A0A0W0Y6H0_9GAMM|nr:D-alanyl-D-alanine carboxypeptidase/D-alanyl-D-alanine-endopeptidase [Legionella quinlivanii]KTD52557.1 D-alanyl-D-alanine carboxypeptidase/D-alanyl-D-alanine-endopeptidase [Legionella quinlivanii]MCW8449743.1 D-alanyl-D-alanine carboxypeptidase/D-alanyl-D-alanine-endopeptidase [Legionella quinlivanii]SEF70543.1 D-alanyl-D-alanine carboxypeptidase / D-alanyl-D-alanine-endopeptidase (penicillin-binding protein 4) [Legionella quinlivanii DSM 21216]STY12106.1 D-alanyl-D-alanine carboxypeptidase